MSDRQYDRIRVFEFTADTPLPEGGMPPFLVPGVLHRSVTLLYGQQAHGKSMLALSMAIAVASGNDWLGRPVASAGRVAIVTGDPDGANEYVERLDRARGDLGNGSILVISVDKPASDESWVETARATEDCGL